MTRLLAIGIWAVLAALLSACELTSLIGRGRVAGFLELVERLVATPAPRVLLLLGWMWLGWHLFVR